MTEFQQELDVRNQGCPMPVMKTKKSLKGMSPGEVLHVISTDPASLDDITSLTDATGDKILEKTGDGGEYHFYIKKA